MGSRVGGSPRTGRVVAIGGVAQLLPTHTPVAVRVVRVPGRAHRVPYVPLLGVRDPRAKLGQRYPAVAVPRAVHAVHDPPTSRGGHKSVSGPAPGPAPRTGPRPLGHIGSAGELGRDACQFRDQTQRRTLSLGSTPGTSHALPENERACWEPCVGETYDDAGPPSPRRPRPRPARAAPLAGLSCGGDGERGVALRPLPGGPCSKTDFEPRQPRPHPRAPAVSGPNPPHTPPPYQAARVNFRLLSLQPCPVLRLVAFSCLFPAESGTARGPSPATPGARSLYTPPHAPRGSCAPPRHMSSHLGSISPLLSGHACQLPGPSPLHVRPVLAQSLINRGALLPVTVPRPPRPPP